MSARTDQTRTTIAKDLLAAMLQGACSAAINPLFLDAYRAGIEAAPRAAVRLADALIAELDREEPQK